MYMKVVHEVETGNMTASLIEEALTDGSIVYSIALRCDSRLIATMNATTSKDARAQMKLFAEGRIEVMSE